MLTIAICDDEKEVRDSIDSSVKKIMSEIDVEYEIKFFENGENLIDYIKENEIDVLFLDIQMDGIDGMEAARQLREYSETTNIVFVTSIGKRMSEAFKVRASGFIEKPISYEEIKDDLKRCIREIIKRKGHYLNVRTDNGNIRLYTRDIIYVEVIRKRIIIHTKNDVIEYRRTLSGVMEKLESQLFIQCHKSYRANIVHIKKMNSEGFIMENGDLVPISRKYHKEARSKFYSLVGDII